MSRNGKELWLGSAETYVPGKNGIVYAAPDLIYHYMTEHHYMPPGKFLEGALAATINIRMNVALAPGELLDNAILRYRKVLSLGMFHPELRHLLACSLYERGRIDEATEEWKETIRYDRWNIHAWQGLREVLLQQERWDEAFHWQRICLRWNSVIGFAWTGMGHILAAKAHHTDDYADWLAARDALQDALAHVPEDPACLAELAEAERRVGVPPLQES